MATTPSRRTQKSKLPNGGVTRCTICNHPARTEIDVLLRDGKTTMDEVVNFVSSRYPDTKPPTPASLLRHRNGHMILSETPTSTKSTAVKEPSQLILKDDGQLIDSGGRRIEAVGIAAALKTIVTVGIKNILTHPEKVSPKDTIEALRLMRSLGGTSDELAQLMAIWANSVTPRGGTKGSKRGESTIENPSFVEYADEDIEDTTEVIEVDSWDFLTNEENLAHEKNDYNRSGGGKVSW